MKGFFYFAAFVLSISYLSCGSSKKENQKKENQKINQYEAIRIVSAIYQQMNITSSISDFLQEILSKSPDCSEEINPGEKNLNCYLDGITVAGKIKMNTDNRYTFDLSIEAGSSTRVVLAKLYTNILLSGEGFTFEKLNAKIDIKEDTLTKSGEIFIENILHIKMRYGYILRTKNGKIFTKWTDTLNSSLENFEYIQNTFPDSATSDIVIRGIFEAGADSSCPNPNRINLEANFIAESSELTCVQIKSLKINDANIDISDPQVCSKTALCLLKF